MRSWFAIVTLCAGLAAWPAAAWWDGGHMQIAALAYDRLDPAVRTKVDGLIKLNPDYSKWIDGVADADRDRFAFVRASTLADDIKGEDGYTDSGDTPTSHSAARNIGYADSIFQASEPSPSCGGTKKERPRWTRPFSSYVMRTFKLLRSLSGGCDSQQKRGPRSRAAS